MTTSPGLDITLAKKVLKFSLFGIGGLFLFFIILKSYVLGFFLYTSNFYLISFILVFLIIQYLAIIGAIHLFNKKNTKEEVREKSPGIKILIVNIFQSFLYAIIFILFLNIFLKLGSFILGITEYKSIIEFSKNQVTNGFPLVILFTIGILSAIFEEYLFREFVQKNLTRFFNITGAILISSFIFSLYHFQQETFYPILFLGVYLGVIYHKFGLRTAIITHLLINLISFSVNSNNIEYLWFKAKDFSLAPNLIAQNIVKNSNKKGYDIYAPQFILNHNGLCLDKEVCSSLKDTKIAKELLEKNIKNLEEIKLFDKDNLEIINSIVDLNKTFVTKIK